MDASLRLEVLGVHGVEEVAKLLGELVDVVDVLFFVVGELDEASLFIHERVVHVRRASATASLGRAEITDVTSPMTRWISA